MLPPFDFDVREYHLQAPKEFFQAGRITFLPHNVYANMPLGTEMLSLAGMVVIGDWWTGALVGKTLIAGFAPLTALGAVRRPGRRLASPSAGVLAALVYISIPWIALVSTQGLVEGAFAFYLFAASTPCCCGATATRKARASLADWLVLAGFLAGGAVATKYPGVVYLRAAAGRRDSPTRRSRQARPTSGASPPMRRWPDRWPCFCWPVPPGLRPVVRQERRAHRQPDLSAALQFVRRRNPHAGKRRAVVASAPPAELRSGGSWRARRAGGDRQRLAQPLGVSAGRVGLLRVPATDG